MASHLLPASAQAIRQSRTRKSVHALPLRAALIAFIAIVILFRWLHLIVSLQVASTDRQIQMSADELAKVERSNAALLYSIAESSSPRSLAQRAMGLGYGPQTPAYLSSDEPILPTGEGNSASPLADEGMTGFVRPEPGTGLEQLYAQTYP